MRHALNLPDRIRHLNARIIRPPTSEPDADLTPRLSRAFPITTNQHCKGNICQSKLLLQHAERSPFSPSPVCRLLPMITHTLKGPSSTLPGYVRSTESSMSI